MPYSEKTFMSIATVTRAAYFAAERHAAHTRKDHRTPYVNHLCEVAALLADAVGDSDPELVMAGYLHDTIEDVDVTREELVTHFGEDVAALVCEVTDDKYLPKEKRKQLQIDHASSKSQRAQWLSLADKTSNLGSVIAAPPPDWSRQRRQEYFHWAKQVVDRFPQPHPVLKQKFDAAVARFWSLPGNEA